MLPADLHRHRAAAGPGFICLREIVFEHHKHLQLISVRITDPSLILNGLTVGLHVVTYVMIECIDSLGNRQGSPGIYADAPNEVVFDYIKVTPNKQ